MFRDARMVDWAPSFDPPRATVLLYLEGDIARLEATPSRRRCRHASGGPSRWRSTRATTRSPREADRADVAERLGCAPSTASERLRKAERRVVRTFLGRWPP